MGNETSTASGNSEPDELNQNFNKDIRIKSVPTPALKPTPELSEDEKLDAKVVKPDSNSQSKHMLSSAPIENDELLEEKDIDPMDVLFQFIPYYAQGDPTNDSLV